MQWAKAVIFTDKGIVATKGCKPKFEELTAYFKAYDSRDETIGRGTSHDTQGLSYSASTTTCTDTILLWSMAAEVTPRLGRGSVAQWVNRRRARRPTC
jgi:hypothetical protein